MEQPQIFLHRTCRACRGALREILNLGNLRLNAFPQHRHEVALVPRVPLILTHCEGCGLVQLDRTVPADWMYRTYYYRSGVNESMVAELQSVVEEALTLLPWMDAERVVLDIGANDGTLLSVYATDCQPPPYRIGVEPAHNLQARLEPHCDLRLNEYFPTPQLTLFTGRVSIISAIACSYDLEDPVAFFRSLHDLLAPGGVAIVQFQDFGQQIESAAFDTICHEHLEYYTLWSLLHLLRDADLTVQRATPRAINGGSLRVVLRRAEDCVLAEDSVGYQLVREAQQGLDTPTIREGASPAFAQFAHRVARAQRQIAAAVQQATDQGLMIDVYGASTKGNILLQVLGIGTEQVRQAIDRSPEKAGLHTITGIPIVGEVAGRADPADIFLAPIWQFRESMLRREQWILDEGGTIIFPLPHCEIVRGTWKV